MYPLRILYELTREGPAPSLMAVSVPKRLFKRAVDRNLLKRRIREAYRLQKPGLNSALIEKDARIQMVIQYRGTEIKDYTSIENGLNLMLKQITENISKNLT